MTHSIRSIIVVLTVLMATLFVPLLVYEEVYAEGDPAAYTIGKDVKQTVTKTNSTSVQSETPAADTDSIITVTNNTHSMSTGTYEVKEDVTINPDWSNNGIRVEKGAKVLLYIDEGKTLTVTGGRQRWYSGAGFAAILLPEGSTLTVAGKGTLNATGGNAGDGDWGEDAEDSFVWYARTSRKGGTGTYPCNVGTGAGGAGGKGGSGAGAGIGTNGGSGSSGGAGGASVVVEGLTKSNVYGNEGSPGEPGSMAEPAGTLIVTGSVTVNAKGGRAGSGGRGGQRGFHAFKKEMWEASCGGTSGGGGGGGGGSAADGIGSGGTGGGGGGGGASGNVDGECALFRGADLDNLWGYGGEGGYSNCGGKNGDQGNYGADVYNSDQPDDTDASRKYAKSGGAGGSCTAPKAVAFYTYKSSPDDDPKVTCTTGHGVTRSATFLSTMQDFMNKGGSSNISVIGGSSTYDGKPHGVSVDVSDILSAQAIDTNSVKLSAGIAYNKAYNTLRMQDNGEPAEWDENGETTVNGTPVKYWITYFDASGSRVGAIPVMPGLYAAVITFVSEDPQYCGDWVEPFAINKIQIEKPTPAVLTFECADWYTGEGAEQDAFPDLDETYYEFDADAKIDDETVSTRSAKAAGSYQACFRLKDPATCEWAGESENSEEVWVPWSIALQEFDANDPEITYWSTDPASKTTTFDYTGEIFWVRPWWTPAEEIGGKFPDWFTHWGEEDRPTTNRLSSAVFYVNGDDDREGLVGYHSKGDGTFEPVTAEQIYAWMYGVEIDGELKTVESGEKVWYKTDEEGWKVPLAVGETGPKGAEGYVVARDYAYADRLGVKEPGIYQAYALFDDGAGFAPTSLAETTVIVGTLITDAKVTGITNKTYTGRKQTQSGIKVVLNGETLVKGKDYKVTYTNNKNAGTAKVKISGIGEHVGTISKTFKIKKAVRTVKSVSPKSGSVKEVSLGKSFKIKAAPSKEKGKAQFKKLSGNSKLRLTSAGKVTAKMGLAKGRTYTLKYKVRIKATKNFKATKYVTRTVKIKIKK